MGQRQPALRPARRSRPASRSPARSTRRPAPRRRGARSPARPRSRRSRAGRRTGIRAPPDPGRTAITKSPRSRAASSRPSWAGPAPRTSRRFGSEPGSLATRPHCRDTTRRCARGRPRTTSGRASRAAAPPCRSMPMWRSTWPGRSGTCVLSSRGLPSTSSTRSRDLRDRDVDARRDVEHLAGDAVDVGGDHGLDRLGVVVDVEPVARGVPVAVDGQRLVRERLRDEARDHLLRVLARAVVVERPHDHDRQPVRDPVRVREPVGARLRRRVRRARVERMLLAPSAPSPRSRRPRSTR